MTENLSSDKNIIVSAKLIILNKKDMYFGPATEINLGQ